ILALKDSGVMVHAMGKESAARVTLRTVEELEQLAQRIPPMAYDIESYASLGLLSGLLEMESAEDPTQHDLESVTQSIAGAFEDIQQQGRCDLSHRLQAQNRQASLRVRELMKAQWS
ncbi:MAG: biotin-independent malonate decarboxylase subunit gamma, partial [Acinetobacter sp.]